MNGYLSEPRTSPTHWWVRLAHQPATDRTIKHRRPMDTEEFSDHMLRDVGLQDGRPVRSETPPVDVLNDFLKYVPRRFL